MTLPILIEPCDGQFAASLAGSLKLRVVRATRSAAVDALRSEIENSVALGELITLDIDTVAVSSLAGKYADDPTLQQICDTIYAKRDADRNR